MNMIHNWKKFNEIYLIGEHPENLGESMPEAEEYKKYDFATSYGDIKARIDKSVKLSDIREVIEDIKTFNKNAAVYGTSEDKILGDDLLSSYRDKSNSFIDNNESKKNINDRDEYMRRKEERRKEYNDNKGLKMVKCVACNGSGYYDHNGSPKCSSCQGTGRVKEKLGSKKK